jgi:hypothetical protein
VNQVHEQIQHLRFVERRVAMLAGRRGAGERKNPRANDRSDPQRRQRPWSQRLFEAMFRMFRIRDQLINGLLGEKLAGQKGLLGFLNKRFA